MMGNKETVSGINNLAKYQSIKTKKEDMSVQNVNLLLRY